MDGFLFCLLTHAHRTPGRGRFAFSRVVPLAAYGLYAIDTALHSPSLRQLSGGPRSRSVLPAPNIALSVTGPNCRSNERPPKFVKRTSLAKTLAANSATVATSAPLPTTRRNAASCAAMFSLVWLTATPSLAAGALSQQYVACRATPLVG